VICGAEHWTEVEEFGLSKESWFRTFLKLENSIPSHDTFGNFFAVLNPEAFEKCFIRWVEALTEQTNRDAPIWTQYRYSMAGTTIRMEKSDRHWDGRI
jgi:hypothetical protein